MDSNPWQVGAWIVAIVGGLIAAGLAIWQAAQNRQQRALELRWKQADSAKHLIDEIFHDEFSNCATLMLDSWDRAYPIPGASKVKIPWEDVVRALKVQSFDTEDLKSIFVRDCFDTLFYYLDRFEHFIQVGLTTFEDLRMPTQYYVDMMAEDKALFVSYIKYCKYTNIWQFLDRFPKWVEEQLPRGEQEKDVRNRSR